MPGSKRERSPGKWTLTVTLGTDYKGKKKRFNKTFHGSAAEADKELALFYADCVSDSATRSSSLTVKDMISEYINDRPEGSIKINTVEGYEKTLRCWIDPYIGSIKISKLTPRKIQSWINDLSEIYSPKTIDNALGLLSASFDREIRLDAFSSNPCKKVIKPKPEKKPAKYYNDEETAAFIKALNDLPEREICYKVLLELALFCGLRKSELLGLEKNDVDLKNCTISIRQGRHKKTGGGSRLDTPKTEMSARTIGFPQEIKPDFIKLFSLYSDFKLKLGDEWHHSDALFRGHFGYPINTNTPLEKLHEIQDRYGLKRITLHQLRHTNASIMISMGLDLKTMQQRGGWSNSNTLLNTYGHVFKQHDEKIAGEIYQAAIGKTKTK